jgi:hypothetical protein
MVLIGMHRVDGHDVTDRVGVADPSPLGPTRKGAA